ncbi:uncharacterized protein EDB91DRAFT_1087952 [Suillus paluster]|uniref:uncharacterized protein n=1 Tax=Suillus paluster TaxID=48578 RepID=UPI001B87FA0A|nr:uncharacterized protein EDB91DRAFT_1087952 [Suillus paluster]KAG1722956.1 hypothetical protein EDB91DRAFT_1087952 [Suillus paluster]
MSTAAQCKMTIHAGVLIGRDRRLGPLPTPDRSYRETYSLSRVPSTSAVVLRSRSVSAFAPTNNYYAVVHVAFAYRRYPVPLFTLRLIPAHYIFYQTITIAIMRRAPLKYLTKRNFQGGGNVPTHIVWTGTKSPTPIGIIIMPASSKIYRDYTWAGSIPPLGLVPRPADMLFVEGQTCICYPFASRKARPQSTPSTQAEAAEVHSFLGFRTDKAEAPRLAAVPIPNSFDSFKQSGQFKSCYVKSGGSKSGLFCRFQALHDIRREVKNNAAQTMHHRGQEERSASRSVELGSLLSLVTNRSDALKSSKDNEYQIQERDGIQDAMGYVILRDVRFIFVGTMAALAVHDRCSRLSGRKKDTIFRLCTSVEERQYSTISNTERVDNLWRSTGIADIICSKRDFRFIESHITSSQTMRFSFILAVAAALTASISVAASDATSETCYLCRHNDDCKSCTLKKTCQIWICSEYMADGTTSVKDEDTYNRDLYRGDCSMAPGFPNK